MKLFWLKMAQRELAFAQRMRALAKEHRAAMAAWKGHTPELMEAWRTGCGSFAVARQYLTQARQSLAYAGAYTS